MDVINVRFVLSPWLSRPALTYDLNSSRMHGVSDRIDHDNADCPHQEFVIPLVVGIMDPSIISSCFSRSRHIGILDSEVDVRMAHALPFHVDKDNDGRSMSKCRAAADEANCLHSQLT